MTINTCVFTTVVEIKDIISAVDEPCTPPQFHILPSLQEGSTNLSLVLFNPMQQKNSLLLLEIYVILPV